jgi:hypothetical protein
MSRVDKLSYHSGRDDWLATYKRIEEIIEQEGMKGEIGRPFDWMVDLLKSAKIHIEILNLKKRRQKKRTTRYIPPEPEEPNPYHGTYSEE